MLYDEHLYSLYYYKYNSIKIGNHKDIKFFRKSGESGLIEFVHISELTDKYLMVIKIGERFDYIFFDLKFKSALNDIKLLNKNTYNCKIISINSLFRIDKSSIYIIDVNDNFISFFNKLGMVMFCDESSGFYGTLLTEYNLTLI